MASPKDYATRQDIREEAGRQHVKKGETMSGTADGTNKTFSVARTPIVDRNYDDVLDASDVTVYDDGSSVGVASVNGTTGEITLDTAPAADSTMTADYEFSELKDTKVDRRRDSAIAFITRKLKGVIDVSNEWTNADDIPDEIKTVVTMYASGLILIRDYGSSADTDETSKDGYKRLNWAKKHMSGYVEDVAGDAGTAVRVGSTSKTDGNIFTRETDLTDEAHRVVRSESTDEEFFQ